MVSGHQNFSSKTFMCPLSVGNLLKPCNFSTDYVHIKSTDKLHVDVAEDVWV